MKLFLEGPGKSLILGKSLKPKEKSLMMPFFSFRLCQWFHQNAEEVFPQELAKTRQSHLIGESKLKFQDLKFIFAPSPLPSPTAPRERADRAETHPCRESWTAGKSRGPSRSDFSHLPALDYVMESIQSLSGLFSLYNILPPVLKVLV